MPLYKILLGLMIVNLISATKRAPETGEVLDGITIEFAGNYGDNIFDLDLSTVTQLSTKDVLTFKFEKLHCLSSFQTINSGANIEAKWTYDGKAFDCEEKQKGSDACNDLTLEGSTTSDVASDGSKCKYADSLELTSISSGPDPVKVYDVAIFGELACEPGHYVDNEMCKDCPEDTFSTGGTATECTRCRAGFISAQRSTSEYACIDAVRRQYSRSSMQSVTGFILFTSILVALFH